MFQAVTMVKLDAYVIIGMSFHTPAIVSYIVGSSETFQFIGVYESGLEARLRLHLRDDVNCVRDSKFKLMISFLS